MATKQAYFDLNNGAKMPKVALGTWKVSELTNALSFYNLHGAKCFVPVQIFCVGPKIYLDSVPVTNILCQTKDDLHSVKLFFVLAKKVLKRH